MLLAVILFKLKKMFLFYYQIIWLIKLLFKKNIKKLNKNNLIRIFTNSNR